MEIQRQAGAWSQEVFGGCELGDKRRTRRLVILGASLGAHVGSSPYTACRGDEAANEGAYRLLRNDAVEAQAIAEGGFQASVRAAHGCAEVLAVEDTTTLSYAHDAARDDLGDLGGPAGGHKRGFQVHSVLLVDAAGERTLGLVEQQRWCRDSARRGQKHRRAKRAYEAKESFKWQRAGEALSTRMGEAMSRVVSVCDREADVFEYLDYKLGRGERFVVRAAWNRRTSEAHQGLFDTLEAAPVLGRRRVQVVQRGGRRAREACVELRACEVELRAPKNRDTGKRVRLWGLMALEREPPEGVEALRWVLLSSEAMGTEADAQRLMRYYELRWRIEEFHKAWKSGGANVEKRRMHSADNLERMAVILAFVAVRVMQLREVLHEPSAPEARAKERRCDEVLEAVEWKVLWLSREKKALPETPPSLRWAYESVAKLGGWIDTKRTGRAGWKALWEGWFILEQRVDGYHLAQQLNPQSNM